jgi:hypothetical protein
MRKLIADVLQEFHTTGKTGALFIVVKQSSEYLVRFYLEGGEILRVSYGPLRGRECLSILDCYDFNKAVFFLDMKTPRASNGDMPITSNVISILRSTGKTIDELHFAAGRDPFREAVAAA